MFRAMFRPSSGALEFIYSMWYYSPKLLPTGVLDELKTGSFNNPSPLYMFRTYITYITYITCSASDTALCFTTRIIR
jgi:hypothetical protein